MAIRSLAKVAGEAIGLIQRHSADRACFMAFHMNYGNELTSKLMDVAVARPVSTSVPASHGGGEASSSDETISVTFTDEKDGSMKTVSVPIGQSLLEAAHANDIDLEGACEGSLACSTCHIIVEDPKMYEKIPEPCDDENDMLDLAFGLTDTSRLGCQVKASRELDGLKVRIPAATRNFAVDGFVPKPH